MTHTTRLQISGAYLGFHKGGKFLLATSAHTRGANHIFIFYPMVKKNFAKGGPLPNALSLNTPLLQITLK